MDMPARPPLTPEIVDALYDAAERLLLYTMAGEHLRAGEGFIPAHEMQEAARIAEKAFSADQMLYMANSVAEFNEDDFFQAPVDLSVRVVSAGDYHYRWILLRALADGGYAEHAASDTCFDDYPTAFSAGTAALAAEGRQRGEHAYDEAVKVAEERRMHLPPGVA